MSRRTRRSKSATRQRGRGYGVDVAHTVAVGEPVFAQYTGVGKDCPDAVVRPGMTSFSHGALPGMAGGRRRTRGGRYGLVDGAPLDPNHAIGMSSYAPVSHVPCEASRATGALMQGGFAVPVSTHAVASQAADMAVYRAPTAGYTHDFDARNGGMMINTPYEAHASNAACKTTGGRRRTRRSRRARRSRSLRSRRQRR